MPKMKSKRGLMKRIKITGTGKIIRGQAYYTQPHKTKPNKRDI